MGNIINKIKNYEDAAKALGIEPANKGIPFLNPEDDEQIKVNSSIKLERIIRALNEGWRPDWNNSNQWKYYPWFDMRSKKVGSGLGLSFDDFAFGGSRSDVGSRLVFRSSELAEYAGKQFIELYADIMVIPEK